MSHLKTEHIAKLTDKQLYALSRCSLLDASLKTKLQAAVTDRQLDIEAHEKQWNAIIQQPFSKLSPKDQIILWAMAVCFPVVLELIPFLFSYFYFRNNPYRFEVYLKRGLVSMLLWCVIMSIYLYYTFKYNL